MKNMIKSFFDELAYTWDDDESCPTEKMEALLSKIGIKEGDKVLDIACGTGVATSFLHKLSNTEFTGIYLSSKMIEVARLKFHNAQYATFIEGDFLLSNFEYFFDVAVIYNAYPHFLEPHLLANKLKSVLHPKGKFAIVHSLSKEERKAHHFNKASDVSRNLLSPIEEFKSFEQYFNLIYYEDNNEQYMIIGELK